MLRTLVARSVGRTAAVSALTAVLVTGCGDGGGWCGMPSGPLGGGVSDLAMGGMSDVGVASVGCAAGVEYQGRFYMAWSAELPVAKGHLLGDGVYPACEGAGDCAGGPGSTARPTQVWAMRGVDPGRVVVARLEGRNRFAVFGRPNADPANYFRFVGGTWHIRDGLAPGQ